MNALNIVSILLNNNVNPIRFGLSFHIFFMISLYTTNGSYDEWKLRRSKKQNNDRFYFKVLIYVTVFFPRFFLVCHFEKQIRRIKNCCCHFCAANVTAAVTAVDVAAFAAAFTVTLTLLLFLPLLAAVDAFGFISFE